MRGVSWRGEGRNIHNPPFRRVCDALSPVFVDGNEGGKTISDWPWAPVSALAARTHWVFVGVLAVYEEGGSAAGLMPVCVYISGARGVVSKGKAAEEGTRFGLWLSASHGKSFAWSERVGSCRSCRAQIPLGQCTLHH